MHIPWPIALLHPRTPVRDLLEKLNTQHEGKITFFSAFGMSFQCFVNSAVVPSGRPSFQARPHMFLRESTLLAYVKECDGILTEL